MSADQDEFFVALVSVQLLAAQALGWLLLAGQLL